MNADCLVVGCGLSGAVVARHLAEKCRKKVLIVERRSQIGGNMYDFVDEHGILVHKYGPHTFHTSEKTLFDFICLYARWKEFHLTCMAEIDGKVTPSPFNFQTIDDFYSKAEAEELKRHIKNAYGTQQTATVLEVLQNSDPLIASYARFLFEKDYSLYTAKQWGVPPETIDPSVLKRVPLRFSYDVGYFDDLYQVMPETSYTDFFSSLLNHPNITVQLNTEALKYLRVSSEGTALLWKDETLSCPVIYTGALDELFGCSEGRLPYRSLRFEWKYENIESKQPAPVVAYPQANGLTRITEYKKIPKQKVQGTTYAVEYPLPYDPEINIELYYPVLTEQSQKQYQRYLEKAQKIRNLFLCGRLADFMYYNMDQALKRALALCEKFT